MFASRGGHRRSGRRNGFASLLTTPRRNGSRPGWKRRSLHAALLGAGVLALPLMALWPVHAGVAGSSGWQWFKSDPHVHDVVSGDAVADIGRISMAGKAYGYNAMFLTDHEAGSNFAISTVVANHVQFDDSLGSKWIKDVYGSPSATVNELVTSPVRSGSYSEHLKSSSNTFGEALLDLKRGPNLRSGDLILKFSVYPKTIGSNGGLYASVSLGGDPSVDTPEGYTTAAGVISAGKSVILVWQCGTARSQSTSDPSAQVLVSILPSCTTNTWNDYTINITKGTASRNGAAAVNVVGINSIAASDLPVDYEPLIWIKMAAAAQNGGVAEGYFDKLNLDASTPVPSGAEFAYRNTKIDQFNTAMFKLFPSIEMGFNRHAQRFNFAITDPTEYNTFFQCDSSSNNCKITNGTAGILPTQQTGYPAQLNHPNMPGGVKLDEIQTDDYQAFGADVMEVRPDSGGIPPTTMVDIWDSMLQRGNIVLGTWSSDMHKVRTLDVGDRGVATYLYAPSLSFDPLMRSLFEGRMYLARNTFNGRIIFNLDPSSPEPYAARYPTYVSDAASSAAVYLHVTDSVASASNVRWLVNGTQMWDDSASGSYEATKNVPLSGTSTYVRAELHTPAVGSIDYIGMTEPIFFIDVPGLPNGVSFRVTGVDTPDGRTYTKTVTKGITSESWNSTAKSLALTLTDPASSLVTIEAQTGTLTPQQVLVDGSQTVQSTSQSAFDSAAGSTWYFEPLAHKLELKVDQPSSSTSVRVDFGGSADAQAPSVPSSVTAAALDSSSIRISWQASSDNVGVAGYHVYRDAAVSPTASITSGTSWTDTGLQPSSTHSYTVDAFDAAGNTSSQSSPASATTLSSSTVTFGPQADAYVRSDFPTANNGTSTTLRLDASPTIRTYVRFNVSGLSGTVTKALLRLAATSSGSGYDVHGGVTDNSWTETGITYANAPSFSPVLVGSTGSFAAGATTSVDVSSAIVGTGMITLEVDTSSTTAMSFSSREGPAPPQLVVTTSGGTVDTQAPSVPSSVTAAALDSSSIRVSWQASSDNVGVAGYHVYRDAAVSPTATVTSATSWTDTALQPSSTHSYTVDAFDAAGNTSPQSSPPASATTPSAGGTATTTFTPVADATVNADFPSSNFGSDTKLRIDTSPTVRSYLRFSISGLSGTVTRALLRLQATSAGAGVEIHALNPPGGWSESTITYSTAPPVLATAIAIAPSFALGDWVVADVTPLVVGNGTRELAITGVSSTAASFSSREAAAAPQLVVTTTS